MNRPGRALVQRAQGDWFSFEEPAGLLVAGSGSEVGAVLADAEDAARGGLFACGWIAYTAAPAFDSALVVRPHEHLPAAWFGLYRVRRELAELPPAAGGYRLGSWRPSVSRQRYRSALRRIRAYIAAGDTYQVNYSLRLRAPFRGDSYALFRDLCLAQGRGCCAYIAAGFGCVCSASPELFFARHGARVIARPMKGTARRGLTWEQDVERGSALRASEKERAENIMIVDMVRNDLGRVARPGSVRVSSTFDVERYPTVFQLTSTVEALTDRSQAELLRALFPCASVTGAPKVRTMQIIRELEPDSRGLYTGAVGYLGPGREARFNVAIRTVVVASADGTAEYGVGGGVVWDSEPSAEYDECLAKAAVLHTRRPAFDLLETMLWTRGGGYYLLERHLERLRRSAEYFDYRFDPHALADRLIALAAGLRGERYRVRLLLARAGCIRLETAPLAAADPQDVPQLGWAAVPVDANDVFLYHKTTERSTYERARAAAGENCDDAVLWNRRGEVTETTIGNIAVRRGEHWYTPPVRCGLLGGTLRAALLDAGELREEVISLEELAAADAVCMINSVRGWTLCRQPFGLTPSAR